MTMNIKFESLLDEEIERALIDYANFYACEVDNHKDFRENSSSTIALRQRLDDKLRYFRNKMKKSLCEFAGKETNDQKHNPS